MGIFATKVLQIQVKRTALNKSKSLRVQLIFLLQKGNSVNSFVSEGNEGDGDNKHQIMTFLLQIQQL